MRPSSAGTVVVGAVTGSDCTGRLQGTAVYGGVVKIADFGISKMLSGGDKLVDTAGTPAFMSPELCDGKQYSGRLADVWAFGGTMFMLRFGRPPFLAPQVLQLYYKIINDPLEFPADAAPVASWKRILVCVSRAGSSIECSVELGEPGRSSDLSLT